MRNNTRFINAVLRILSAVIIFVFILPAPITAYGKKKEIVGYIASAHIYPGKLSLRAKIDTGAKTSSLNAPNRTFFNRENKRWVGFDVVNQRGKTVRIEKEVVRTVVIKRKGILSFIPQKRSVIMLGICVGKVYKEIEVNLVDRRHYNYQLLIGRNFLIDSFIVDPSLIFVAKPRCKVRTKP